MTRREFLLAGLVPNAPLPTPKTDLMALPRRQDTIVWLGHSSFFVQLSVLK